MTQHLYHFSEDPAISVFEPRSLPRPERAPEHRWLDGPLVWAIDEWHSPLYFFPRDCPRIVMWPTPDTTAEDRQRHWAGRDCRMIAHIEWEWLERLRTAALYRYVLHTAPFEELRGPGMSPGTWVSREPVKPLAVEPVGPLLDALRAADVELRLMPSLVPLRNAWDTTLHVSGVRLRNAKSWPH